MLGQRIVTALVLLGLFLSSLFAPWNIFPALVVVALTLAAWEWALLADLKGKVQRAAFVGVVILLLILMVVFQAELMSVAFKIALFVFWFWILLLPLLYRYPDTVELFRIKPLAVAISILILISTAAGLLWLRLQEHGPWLLLLLVAIVAVADSGAYFAGRAFGKTPLAPAISPAKTFEGVYGGLLGNFLVALALSIFLNLSPEKSFALVLVVIGTSLFSVEGDLLESAIKRSRGVKDSGHILPGHGGVLDRIDGLCAATPCFVFGILLTGL